MQLDLLNDFLSSLLFEIFEWVVLSLIPASFAGIYFFFKRRKLNSFFGINKINNNILIYLSSLFIPRGASTDSFGNHRSYEGIALPQKEFESIPNIYRTFQLNFFEKILAWTSRGIFLRDLEINIKPSPFSIRDINHTNIITLGGSGYNKATEYYFNLKEPFFKFINNNSQIMINKGKKQNKVISSQNDLGVIQKIVDTAHSTVIFITAGLGTNGTRGALEYLLQNWKDLQKKYKNTEFGICLEFPYEPIDPKGYLRPKLIEKISS